MSDLEDQSDTIFEGFAPNSISASIFFRSNLEKSFQRGVHPQSTIRVLSQLFAIVAYRHQSEASQRS